MDDCNLEKLSAAPAKLSPKFNRNTTEYESTVPSSVEKVKLDCLTSDSGASYQIFGGGGEKTVLLKEGEVTEIRIEVSAEDGTVKNYFIRVKRLSASDASLSQLSLSCGKLDPSFAMECEEYTATVPCNVEKVTVNPVAPDKKCCIVVKGSEENFVMPLLLGETIIIVRVSSVDGTNTKDYAIIVYRKQLPWPVTLKDKAMSMKTECPMMLTPMYNPVSVLGSDPKVSMSQPCIDMLTRRSKVNPINDVLLEKDWRVVDIELDKLISNCVASSVYSYKGVKDELTFQSMASHVNSCEQKPAAEVDPKKVTETSWYKSEFESSTAKPTEIKHKVEVRNWEKRLHHMASETNADVLLKDVEKRMKSYRSKLPLKPGQNIRFDEGESPVDDLNQVCINLAAAIKAKSKDASFHLKLAFALEEQHHLLELYGFSKQDQGSSEAGAGTNVAAQESSKLEECQAICRLRGVAANAPIALQLKAIDEEYKSLLDGGQSGKADHVQELYAWRSKQALKGSQSGLKHLDENEPIAQAYLKYMDGLVLDPNNYLCNLHASRMLLERDDHQGAVVRLQQAVGLKPNSSESRFFLGLALCQKKDGPGDRLTEALFYLHEGLEHLLMHRQREAETEGVAPSSSTPFHCEDIFRISNVQVLRGLMTLAEMLGKNPQSGMRSAKEVYHCVCLHSAMALCAMFHRGQTFQQIEWILLDAHYQLLTLMMQDSSSDTAWTAQRCRYLSAMIRSATIPRDKQLLTLQEKVSQHLVSINPCSSEALYLLGLSQFMIFDSELKSSNDKSLLEAISSLEASIALEGKPASGEPPALVTGQQWWQDKVAGEKAKAQAAHPTTPAKVQPAARGKAAPPAARGRAKAAPASQRGAKAPVKPPPARGRGAPARGGRGGVTSPTASSSDTRCDKSAQAAKPDESKPAASKPDGKPAPINRSSYLARLALARALSRTGERKEEARGSYEEVIKMAPEVHDSYIELAELLVHTDPLAAVDIYCRFPSSSSKDEDSFDDAYLSGEIVSILMKHEKYDDTRLVDHMVKWGRVMGIGVLEKHMGILDAKFKTDMLKKIYAGVHRKAVDDEDLVAFFKFKCWI